MGVSVDLIIIFEKEARSAYYSLLVWCSTTHHGVQLMLGINQGGNQFTLAEMGIQYQYTHAKSMILSLCQILLLFRKSRSNSSTGADCMIWSREKQTYVLGHVGTNWLIRSGLIWLPVRPSKGQSDGLQTIDHSFARSMTAQQLRFCPSALRVTTLGQQVASLGEGLPNCRGVVGIFYSPSKQSKIIGEMGRENEHREDGEIKWA